MSNIVNKFSGGFNEKIVQVSLISAVLFYVVANPSLFDLVDNTLNNLGRIIGVTIDLEGQSLLILHSLVFAVLVGVTIRYVFEPVMNRKLVNNSS